MLATQLNHFITNNEVVQNGVIQLDRYICNAVSGIPMADSSSTTLACIFEHDTATKTDTLSISFDGLLSGDVPVGSLLLQVDGVRAPPTTNVVTGFTFKTATANGDIIDQSTDPTAISLQVNTPLLA